MWANNMKNPKVGDSVHATSEHMSEKEGAFLGKIKTIRGNQIDVEFKGQTSIYLWRFANGDFNKWLNFGDL